MSSMKAPGNAWKIVAMSLAVTAVIVTQAVGIGVGSSQEPASPPLEEELTKQEEIFHSRGPKVPDGYITYRALTDYVQLLPSDFCDTLRKLGSADRWLDVGAGDGQAILDYYAPEKAAVPTRKCVGPGAKARAVAMSIEDRRTEKWRQQAASVGVDRIRYLSGKRLRHYSHQELGKFQIITDVYGGFSYTEDLSRFLETVLSLLETNGVFYTVVQNVHLDASAEDPGTGFQTELVDAGGRAVKVCSWLKKTTCVKVGCESKSEWDSPSELIHIRKVCSDVSVPRMKLVQYQAGNPPARRFLLNQ